MSQCSEVESMKENMKISISYYNFIKEVFEDYINSVSYYKDITNDYKKKLEKFQIEFGEKLIEKYNIKYEEINKSHTYSIISSITKLVKQQIEQLKIIIKGIDSQLENYKSTLRETKILSSKSHPTFNDVSKDLLKKYKDIDDARYNFNSCMNKTKLILNKFIINNKSTSYNDVNKAITNSKESAEKYINLINTVKPYEDDFDKSYQSSIDNMVKLTSETSEKLKDFVFDLILCFQSYNKMLSSEIEYFLQELSKLNETQEMEKITKNSYKKDNKLCHVERDKYKFILFQDNNNAEEDAKILDYEDDNQRMIIIKDELLINFLKTMKNEIDLIEYDFDLVIEEEKCKCMKLTEKVLEIETKPNNIGPTEEEVNQLNTLLDKHHNRVVFLGKLSNYRSGGGFELKSRTFEIFSKLFYTIIDKIDRDNDYFSVKSAIIISQTYYITQIDNEKLYLEANILCHQLFRSEKFWEDYLNYSINKEIAKRAHLDYENGTIGKETQKEADEKKSNIAFTELLTFATNMTGFGLDKNFIREIISPKMDEFKLSEDLKVSIEGIIINGKK